MMEHAIPLVDLKAQYLSIKDEIDGAIARVVSSATFVGGEEVERFEEEFARYIGAAHCVGCGNGTDALELALRAVGVVAGDEVITVAHTFMATVEAIIAVGAWPVFVDVCDDTLVMDTTKIEAAITKRTTAIVPVHLYGNPVDMDPLMRVANQHGLRVVEDAAQAHGARYKDRKVGTITMGGAAAFSFYPGKNLGAYGDAGAVVTNDSSVAEWVRKARDHGRMRKYEHELIGCNSRLDAIQAAVLRAKLKHLSTWTRTRRELAAEYDACLGGVSGVRLTSTTAGAESAHPLYVVRCAERDAVRQRLSQAGIKTGVHYPVPAHLQRAYRTLNILQRVYRTINIPICQLPVTEKAAESVLSLPLYPELRFSQARYVAKKIAELKGEI